jgi:adenylate kinase family enzyme
MAGATHKQPAILLLGPTGSGKTPLGSELEARGLWGRRCVHFDFGENLRQIVAADRPDAYVARRDIEFLKEVLRSGALLEDEHFPLAERVLRRFLGQRHVGAADFVVLNGLPRHVGQATALDAILDVRAVIYLRCSPETVLGRIRSNVGGDRAGRADDDLPAVGRRLATFHERTRPLLNHYGSREVRIQSIEVTAQMTGGQMRDILERECPRLEGQPFTRPPAGW